MNSPVADDPQDPADPGRPPTPRFGFATLVDEAEGRLPAAAQRRVSEQLPAADRQTRAVASWIRSFLDAARAHRRSQVPSRVGRHLNQAYRHWWTQRSRTERDLDWDGQLARLVFDSRRAVNLAGLRGVPSIESVQLAYALTDLDVVIDLSISLDDTYRIEGQLLTSESQPRVTPLSVVLQGIDEEPRQATLDHLNRFVFDLAYGPGLELIVRAGRGRWRLPLDRRRAR